MKSLRVIALYLINRLTTRFSDFFRQNSVSLFQIFKDGSDTLHGEKKKASTQKL